MFVLRGFASWQLVLDDIILSVCKAEPFQEEVQKRISSWVTWVIT